MEASPQALVHRPADKTFHCCTTGCRRCSAYHCSSPLCVLTPCALWTICKTSTLKPPPGTSHPVFLQPCLADCQGRVLGARAGTVFWASIRVIRGSWLLPADAVLALDHACFWHLGNPMLRYVRPVLILDNIPKAPLLALWLDISPFASHRIHPICRAY